MIHIEEQLYKEIENNRSVSKNFNFFDVFGQHVYFNYRNTITKWYSSDTLDKFNSVSKENTYSLNDISYVFNEFGFRSENFSSIKEDEPVVLYGGCSITAGVGLPIDHVWSSMLNKKIAKDIQKDIKLYSLAHGGLSIDTIVRLVYVAVNNNVIKPDIVFLNLPPIWRKEMFEYKMYNISTFQYLPNYTPNIEQRGLVKAWEKFVNLPYMLNDTFKNLLMLKYFLESKNIPMFFTFWDQQDLYDIASQKDTNIGAILDKNLPSALKENYLGCFSMMLDSQIDALRSTDQRAINWQKEYKQSIARDGMHYGPNSHVELSTRFYNVISIRNEYQDFLKKYG